MTDFNSQSARVALVQANAMALAARQRAAWPRWAAITEAVALSLQLLTALYGMLLLQRAEINYNGAIGALLALASLVLLVFLGMFEPFIFRRLGIKPALSKPFSWASWRSGLIVGLLVGAVNVAALRFEWFWAPLPFVVAVVIRIYRRRRRGLGRF